jgi:hypothetical protein
MKFSTKLSHSIIRMRHNFLRLRVQRPLYYKILALLVLIFAIGGLLVGYHFYINSDDPVALGEQTELEIDSYSLNGEVTAINGNNIEMKTGAFKVVNGVSTVEYVQKTVYVNSETQISKVKIDSQLTRTPGTLADIGLGDIIAVYSASDTQSLEVTAEKIEVLDQN